MAVYKRVTFPIVPTGMPDLPMKTRPSDLDKPVPPKRLSQKSRDLMSNPVPPVRRSAKTSTARTAKPASKKTTSKRPSPLQGEQPRDSRGRWVKVGSALWGGTKAVAKGVSKTVKGTAKAVKSVHKTVKRVQTSARKKASLRHREHNIALAKEEHKLGLRKKRVVRKVKKGKK